jgi:hypothetical protein
LGLTENGPHCLWEKGDIVTRLVCFIMLALAGEIAFAQGQGFTADGNNIIGTWVGEWSSSRSGGRLECEIGSFDGERMTGKVNSEAHACTVGWTALSDKVVGDEIHGTYTIGGPCSRVGVVFPIPTGNVIEGKWTSEYPGYGTFRLTKQVAR